MVRFLLWVKRLFWRNSIFCGDCAREIPDGKSAWHNNLRMEWICKECSPHFH